MKRFLALLALLLPACPASAQSITVPATVQIDTAGLVVIRATAIDADDTRWYALTPGIQTFPPDLVPPKAGVFMGLALIPGTYKIGVVPAKAISGKAVIGEAQVVTVTVGSPTPPPPPPPPPPTLDLSAAWTAETDPAKVGQAIILQSLYAYAATEAQDTAVTSWGDYAGKVSARATALGVNGKLLQVQGAVAAALAKACPNSATTGAPLDRSCAGTFFAGAAAAVGALK